MSSLTQCFASGLKHTSNNVIGLIGKSKQVNKVIHDYTGILAEHQGAALIEMLGLAEAPSAPKPQAGQVWDE